MTSIDGSTKFDDLEKISLEYATTYKQYEHIGENNAMKAALLQVCKLWNIVLSCTSFRNDAEEVDKKLGYSAAKDWEEELERYEWIKNSRRVYPCANNDLWIITRIQEKQI